MSSRRDYPSQTIKGAIALKNLFRGLTGLPFAIAMIAIVLTGCLTLTQDQPRWLKTVSVMILVAPWVAFAAIALVRLVRNHEKAPYLAPDDMIDSGKAESSPRSA